VYVIEAIPGLSVFLIVKVNNENFWYCFRLSVGGVWRQHYNL